MQRDLPSRHILSRVHNVRKDVRKPRIGKLVADTFMVRDRRTGQVWRAECGWTVQIWEDVATVRRRQHEIGLVQLPPDVAA